jgi:hypothetical protein
MQRWQWGSEYGDAFGFIYVWGIYVSGRSQALAEDGLGGLPFCVVLCVVSSCLTAHTT